MSFLVNTVRKILPEKYFHILRSIKKPDSYVALENVTYNQDRLITSHNCDFMQEPRFSKAYLEGVNTGSWGSSQIHWRAFIACWAAEKAKSLEGDFVECGVNRGGLSRTVMEYIDFASMKDRKFYLLDTYEGLSEKYISEEERRNGIEAGGYEECYEAVKKTFHQFENAVIIRGAVPETLSEVKSEKVAYLSIDMNCVAPEIAAADFFWGKLVSGGTIILDDYGWTEHIEQKRAFDAFAKRKNISILALPTGQGLILKS